MVELALSLLRRSREGEDIPAIIMCCPPNSSLAASCAPSRRQARRGLSRRLTFVRAYPVESHEYPEEDMSVKVKLGYVPSYRFRFSPWCAKMRDESLAVLRSIEGVEVVVPEAAAEGSVEPIPAKGTTRTGAVSGLDEGEGVAEFFLSEKVDGLVLCPLDFGDERSASKIAEKLRRARACCTPPKSPRRWTMPSLARQSDSYCGNLSMASGLYRRKHRLPLRRHLFPRRARAALRV